MESVSASDRYVSSSASVRDAVSERPRDGIRGGACRFSSHTVHLLICAAISLALSCSVLLSIDRLGIGVSPDSGAYIGAARSLVDSGALRVPITSWDSVQSDTALSHFPPGLPLALAAMGYVFDITPPLAARWLNAVCLAGMAFLILAPLGNRPAGMISALAFLVGPSVFLTHVMVWSEPLFLLLIVAGYRCCELGLRGGKAVPVFALAVFLGLASLTRYAGLFAVPVVLVLFSLSDFTRSRKLRLGVLFLGVYAAILLPWFLWLQVDGGPPRHLGEFNPVVSRIWNQMLDRISGWLFPQRIPMAARNLIFTAAVGAVAGIMVVKRLRHRSNPNDVGPAALQPLIWFVGYLLFIIIARLLADPILTFNQRILAPASIFLGLLVAELARSIPRKRPHHHLVHAAFMIFALWLLYHQFFLLRPCLASSGWLERHIRVPAPSVSLNSSDSRFGELVYYLNHNCKDAKIYCNLPQAIVGYTDRPVSRIPGKGEQLRMADFCERLRAAEPAVLVCLPSPKGDFENLEKSINAVQFSSVSFGRARVLQFGKQ